MIQEYIPPRGNYKSPRLEYQGAPLTCTRFGLTSALEAIALASGIRLNLSVRFIWFYSDRQSLSIDTAVETLNKYGTCLDELCPYDVNYLDVPPSLEAMLDAQSRHFDVQTERIAGKVEIMRALAQGSRLVTKRNTYSGEHAECIIDWDIDKGALIHGSYNEQYWEPWSSFEGGGDVTQIEKIIKCPWPLIPHPDYIPESAPEFDGITLKIPKAMVYKGWPTPSQYFKNIELKFANYGEVKVDDPKVLNRGVIYYESGNRLHMPKLKIAEALYSNVSLTGASIEVLAGDFL